MTKKKLPLRFIMRTTEYFPKGMYINVKYASSFHIQSSLAYFNLPKEESIRWLRSDCYSVSHFAAKVYTIKQLLRTTNLRLALRR